MGEHDRRAPPPQTIAQSATLPPSSATGPASRTTHIEQGGFTVSEHGFEGSRLPPCPSFPPAPVVPPAPASPPPVGPPTLVASPHASVAAMGTDARRMLRKSL